MRFVIVDDNQVDLLLVGRALYGAFPHVTIATVTDESDMSVALVGADVVIADYHLPQMPWPSILRAVQQYAPEALVVVISDMIGDDRGEQAIRDGAADYLPKSALAQLPAMLRRALARQDAQRAVRGSAQQLSALDKP